MRHSALALAFLGWPSFKGCMPEAPPVSQRPLQTVQRGTGPCKIPDDARVLNAMVIEIQPSGQRLRVTIDKGSSDGVTAEWRVLLVGYPGPLCPYLSAVRDDESQFTFEPKFTDFAGEGNSRGPFPIFSP